MSDRMRWLGLVLFMIACMAAGGLGAIATTPEIDSWYATLNKPSWNPPAFIFGPVWTTLYAMMAVAAWLVWKPQGFQPAQKPLVWFAVQLGLNIAWSWIFFRFHLLGFAFAEMLVLWFAILQTILSFQKHSKLASWLLYPYLAWVSFAAVLNFTIWQLN